MGSRIIYTLYTFVSSFQCEGLQVIFNKYIFIKVIRAGQNEMLHFVVPHLGLYFVTDLFYGRALWVDWLKKQVDCMYLLS